MKTARLIRTLGRADLRTVWRDDLSSWLVMMPVGLGLLLRWGLPPVMQAVGAYFGIDGNAVTPLVAACFVVMVLPVISGMVAGFLLLDQRDNRTFTALLVTPVAPWQYMAYSLLVPSIGALTGTFLALWLAIPGGPGPARLAVVALTAAPLAPVAAFTMVCFARNKVEGFALTKGSIALWIAPIASFFVPSAWRDVFGLVPLYWPCRAYVALSTGGPWLYPVAMGWVYAVVLLGLLLRRFNRIVHT